MKIGANLTEAEAKAFKARKEQELGGGWCVDVYRCQGRWLARAYRKGEHSRGPKPGTPARSRSEQRQGGTAASATGTIRQ
jgi:hypothetical protein